MAKSAYNNRLSNVLYYNYITISASYGHVTFIASRSCQNLVGLALALINYLILSHNHENINRKPTVMKKQSKNQCYRCLDNKHLHSDCPFMKSKCYKCVKNGHISKAFRYNKSASDQKPRVYELYNLSD